MTTDEKLRTSIREAVARGWTHETVSDRVMSAALVEAIVDEVTPLLEKYVTALKKIDALFDFNRHLDPGDFDLEDPIDLANQAFSEAAALLAKL